MIDQHKRPQGPNQLAKSIIDSVTGQQPSPVDNRPVAVALGGKAGLKERAARATPTLTPERYAEIAKKATKE